MALSVGLPVTVLWGFYQNLIVRRIVITVEQNVGGRGFNRDGTLGLDVNGVVSDCYVGTWLLLLLIVLMMLWIVLMVLGIMRVFVVGIGMGRDVGGWRSVIRL